MILITDRIFNPWKVSTLGEADYDDIKTQFNLENFEFKLRDNPAFSRRNVMLGHEKFGRWIEAAERGEKVALVSGFMTSGNFHLGSLAVIKQMAYYQRKYGAEIFIPVADLEAICVRGIPRDEIDRKVADFIAHFKAAGLDVEKCKIYLQTQNLDVLRKAFKLVSKTDKAEIEKLYDREMTIGETISSLVQVADILYPQMLSYGQTLITLGIDEISHFVLTKDVINRLEPGFKQPSITYNKLIVGLNGSKMGKSLPENSILLNDSREALVKKLNLLRRTDLPIDRNSAFNILQWYSDDDAHFRDLPASGKLSEESVNKIVDRAIEVCGRLFDEHHRAYDSYLEEAKSMVPGLYIRGSP